MFTELLLKKLIDKSFDIASNLLWEVGSSTGVSAEDYQKALQYHLQFVENWSAEISFNELRRPKETNTIFIDPDLFVYPRRSRIQSNETIATLPIIDLFSETDGHIVLLGQPGAGKTTALKHLCQLLIHDESFYSDRFALPLVIRFRTLNESRHKQSKSLLLDGIIEALGLRINLHKDIVGHHEYGVKEKLVVNTLEELNALVVLDGFDELAQIEQREEAISTIRTLANRLTRSTMIITSRTGDFPFNIEGSVQYEIAPLNSEKISQFVHKWLGNPDSAEDLLRKLYESPFADTAIRPLTLAHLCAIYEKLGSVPDKPKTVYRRIVNLLLEEWDEQRSVKRYSRYARFDVPMKLEFLCQMAYLLTTWKQTSLFSKDDLLSVYELIHDNFNLSENEASLVVNELESHTGLFIQSGFDEFEFAHKSLQEYLAAEYIVRLPSVPSDEYLLLLLPNEIALAVAISSNSSTYLYELVTQRLSRVVLPQEWLKTFLSRLFLEKPDFNRGFEIALALVMLYTTYVRQSAGGFKVLTADPLLSDFEALIELSLQRESLKALSRYFHSDRIFSAENGNDIHSLKLTGEGLILKNKLNLPTHLYVRNSFLELDRRLTR